VPAGAEPANEPVNGAAQERLRVREDHYCFGCGRQNPHGLKLTFFPSDDGGVWCRWTPARESEGFDGIAHGGIIGAVLDEVMGWAVYHRHIWAVTAKMSVGYRRPVPIGTLTRAAARIAGQSGRKLRVTAELRDNKTGQLLADAEALFIRVPEAQAQEWQMRYIDPDAWGDDSESL
jgi:acyl-coenzyme A thioesterase PaaI-like protein